MLPSSQAVVNRVGGSPPAFIRNNFSNAGCGSSRQNLLVGCGRYQRVSWRRQGKTGYGALEAQVGKSSHVISPSGVRCQVISVTQDNFDTEVLQAEIPVLVDFWADWCGPCKLVATSMEKVESKYEGKLKVVKIETDPNPELVAEYKVYGLPTLIMFVDGKPVPDGRYEGAISFSKIVSMIETCLPSLAAA